MTDSSSLTLDEASELSVDVLTYKGFSREHAVAIANVVCAGQRDECHSHGLYRLLWLSTVDNGGQGEWHCAARSV